MIHLHLVNRSLPQEIDGIFCGCCVPHSWRVPRTGQRAMGQPEHVDQCDAGFLSNSWGAPLRFSALSKSTRFSIMS